MIGANFNRRTRTQPANTLRYTGWRRGFQQAKYLSEHNAGWSVRRPASTDFEDYVFRPEEQSSGELLGEVVNLSESPVENGRDWTFEHNFWFKG